MSNLRSMSIVIEPRPCVVLLSGGQDSTTCLFWAKEHFAQVHAVTVSYGQTHVAEVEAARQIGRMAGVSSHVTIALPPELYAGSRSALLAGAGVALHGVGGMSDVAAPAGLPTSFVPGRNLLLLSLAVARAGAVAAVCVVAGLCESDYSGYPDCRADFVEAFDLTVSRAWPSKHVAPGVETPLMYLTKGQTVQLAASMPGCMDALALSVTCYRGKRPGCGECPACELRARGFAEVGVVDPAGT